MSNPHADELEVLLSDESLAQVLISCKIDRKSVRFGFAGGSIVQGWGNEDSDVDLYLVVDQLEPGYELEEVHDTRHAAGSIPVACLDLPGRRADVEVWTIQQVEQVLGLVGGQNDQRSSSALEGLSYFELDFLEKLGHGQAVFGPEEVSERQEQLRNSAWHGMLTEQALLLSDIYLEDAVGQLESSDVISSVLSAKLAFGHSVDAVAVSSGLIGRSPKWRARRVQLADSDVLPFEEYWNIETMQNYAPERPGDWVRHVVSVCRRISAKVAV